MRSLRKQHGIVLLVFAAIFLFGFSAALLYALGKWRDPTTATRTSNAAVLQQAKTALIGYVAKEVLDFSGNDIPGRLPCPETLGAPGTANEGRTGGTCTTAGPSARTIGRLPWRTLGVDKLVDAAGEPLWYAVSPNWVLSGSGDPTINAGTTGQLSVDGVSDVVAVIFAPGSPMVATANVNQTAAGCAAGITQSRNDRAHTSSAANLDYLNYLECQDPSLLVFRGSVVDNPVNAISNDQMVFVTSKEILSAIQGPLSERMQRTIAPLLSEFSDEWVSGGKLLPYAFAFTQPEKNVAMDSHCGLSGNTSQQMEGIVPIAPSSGACASTWTNATISGSGNTGIFSPTCASSATALTCSFSYYKFTPFGQFILGITGIGSVTTTIQARSKYATASFRSPVQTSDIALSPTANISLSNIVNTPRTDGDADFSADVKVTTPNLCRNGLLGLGGLLCDVISALGLANETDVSVTVPNLSGPVLSGTKLSAVAKNGTGPFHLLNPSPGEPSYWFIQGQWYRYTYYALAPSASVAAGPDNLVVNGFPSGFGNNNDKRFVLTLMGPPVTGQARSVSAALGQYIEGANAITGTSPRAFAYQVYTANGNDRIATCPFTDGANPCD